MKWKGKASRRCWACPAPFNSATSSSPNQGRTQPRALRARLSSKRRGSSFQFRADVNENWGVWLRYWNDWDEVDEKRWGRKWWWEKVWRGMGQGLWLQKGWEKWACDRLLQHCRDEKGFANDERRIDRSQGGGRLGTIRSEAASSAQLRDSGGDCGGGMLDVGWMERLGGVGMVGCSKIVCKVLGSVWVQAFVVGTGVGSVWMPESSKTRAGMKQCWPWPSATHSECSSACPSSIPFEKSLIFEDWPSLKPRWYLLLKASSSVFSRVWTSECRPAVRPSSKARSHKYSRFRPLWCGCGSSEEVFDGFKVGEFDKFMKGDMSGWFCGWCVKRRRNISCAWSCIRRFFCFAMGFLVAGAHDVLAELLGSFDWVCWLCL